MGRATTVDTGQPYPLDQPARAAVRRAMQHQYAAQAARLSAAAGRSVKCRGDLAPGPGEPSGPRHADQAGGCTNDGATCLCPCHDRRPG